MGIGEAIILGLVQGLTEFLPVSSSGHLILMRELFGVGTETGLAFDAVLQGATVLAVIIYFRQAILDIVVGSLLYIKTRGRLGREGAMMAIALMLGTIPAILLGVFLEDMMETVFRDGVLVAGALVVGSGIMYAAEYALRRMPERTSALTWRRGVIAGCFQALALVPGMSRSGMTIAGGVFAGLNRETAARFAFLLAVPVLAGTSAKKLWDVAGSGASDSYGMALFVASLAAFLSGFAVIHWLMTYLRTRTLMPFIYYRLALAAAILVFFA